MNNFDMLQQEINKAHNPELSEQVGMVTQLWSDGEITSQKCGDLLWQRSIHTMAQSVGELEFIEWPAISGKYGYIFCTSDDAERIREIFKKAVMDRISMI